MTPTLSVEAVQFRFTWLEPDAVAVKPVGAVGGEVSGAVGTMEVFMSLWISAWVSARL